MSYKWCSQRLPRWVSRPPGGPDWGRNLQKNEDKMGENNRKWGQMRKCSSIAHPRLRVWLRSCELLFHLKCCNDPKSILIKHLVAVIYINNSLLFWNKINQYCYKSDVSVFQITWCNHWINFHWHIGHLVYSSLPSFKLIVMNCYLSYNKLLSKSKVWSKFTALMYPCFSLSCLTS